MKRIQWFTSRIKGFFPHKLPIGEQAFQKFVADIFTTYGIPNAPGYQTLIAQVILHSKETQWKLSPYHLSKIIRKAQANEVAWQVMEDIKSKAKADAAKAVASQQADVAKLQPIVEPTMTVGSMNAKTAH